MLNVPDHLKHNYRVGIYTVLLAILFLAVTSCSFDTWPLHCHSNEFTLPGLFLLFLGIVILKFTRTQMEAHALASLV